MPVGDPAPEAAHDLEAELREQLRTNPEIFDALDRGALDGIWYWDLENPDRGWLSPSFWRSLGHDPTAAGHPAGLWQDLVHPEDRRAAQHGLQAHCADPSRPYDQLVRFRHADGHQLWMRCRGVAIRIDGRPVRMLGTHTDVTEIHQRGEDQLLVERERHGELAEAYRNLAQFTSFASHDLQAPLRTISGFLSLLATKIEDQIDDEGRDWLDRVKRGAQRMQQLIDRLLVYSRTQNRELETERVSIDATLAQVRLELDESQPDHGAEFHIGEMPVVRGDGKMIFQLFENLIGNSIKYRSEAPPRIEIQARCDAGRAHFSLSDNGIGIGPEHQEAVFEAFRRLHSQKAIEGSGLGLAIAQRIVERHGGRIRLESEPGQGTRFHFSLPLATGAKPS